MGSQKSNTPPAPNLNKAYQTGVTQFEQNFPSLLNLENTTRYANDPTRVAQQQALQSQFGPTQYNQQRQALNILDPEYLAGRIGLGQQLIRNANFASNYQLPPSEQAAVQAQVRGAQAARGNIYGGAPATAEAYALGDRGQQLYEQSIQNLGAYLGGPGTAAQVAAVSPVAPDRSFAYANPNAGYLGVQQSLQNYQNQLGASQLNGGVSPWVSALQGLGAAAATYYGGPAGGYAANSLSNAVNYSDKRIKKNIERVGTHPSGAGLYTFEFKHPKGSTDTVPAMLTPHEAVLTPGAADEVGRDNIDEANKANPPKGYKMGARDVMRGYSKGTKSVTYQPGFYAAGTFNVPSRFPKLFHTRFTAMPRPPSAPVAPAMPPTLSGQKPPRYFGAIAQDVQKHVPSAVMTHPVTGIKSVNYAKLGFPMTRIS